MQEKVLGAEQYIHMNIKRILTIPWKEWLLAKIENNTGLIEQKEHSEMIPNSIKALMSEQTGQVDRPGEDADIVVQYLRDLGLE